MEVEHSPVGHYDKKKKKSMNHRLQRAGSAQLRDMFGAFGDKENKGGVDRREDWRGWQVSWWEVTGAFVFTYPHISGLGTHHGGCGGRGEDGGRGQTGGEGREGVLVGVLVLVHVLVLVKLGPQE